MIQSWSVLENRILRSVGKRRIPLAGHFELTARCNLSCRMCYLGTNANNAEVKCGEHDMAWWIHLAVQARDTGMLHLLLTGGEVLLLPWFEELYRRLSELGLLITVNTNATLLSESVAELFSKFPPIQIAVSLYGISPESSKAVTGNEHAYAMALAGLDRMQNRGISFTVKMPVVRSLLQELEPAAELVMSRYGKVLELVDYIEPRREGTGSAPLAERLSPKEFHDFQQSIAVRYKGEADTEGHLGIPDAVEPEENCSEKTESAFSCSAGSQAFWVTWDGRMTPCGSMSEPSVQIGADGFLTAWEALGKQVSQVPSCKACLECGQRDICMACPARLQLETGSAEEKSPYLCEIAQRLFVALQQENMKKNMIDNEKEDESGK